jgi:hypothetical protein
MRDGLGRSCRFPTGLRHRPFLRSHPQSHPAHRAGHQHQLAELPSDGSAFLHAVSIYRSATRQPDHPLHGTPVDAPCAGRSTETEQPEIRRHSPLGGPIPHRRRVAGRTFATWLRSGTDDNVCPGLGHYEVGEEGCELSGIPAVGVKPDRHQQGRAGPPRPECMRVPQRRSNRTGRADLASRPAGRTTTAGARRHILQRGRQGGGVPVDQGDTGAAHQGVAGSGHHVSVRAD